MNKMFKYVKKIWPMTSEVKLTASMTNQVQMQDSKQDLTAMSFRYFHIFVLIKSCENSTLITNISKIGEK